jgi:ribosome modulation factor
MGPIETVASFDDDLDGQPTVGDLIDRWWQMGYDAGATGRADQQCPYHRSKAAVWWRRGHHAGRWAYLVKQSGDDADDREDP